MKPIKYDNAAKRFFNVQYSKLTFWEDAGVMKSSVINVPGRPCTEADFSKDSTLIKDKDLLKSVQDYHVCPESIDDLELKGGILTSKSYIMLEVTKC